jgi:tetratricopeptide (TPR) repeat protein
MNRPDAGQFYRGPGAILEPSYNPPITARHRLARFTRHAVAILVVLLVPGRLDTQGAETNWLLLSAPNLTVLGDTSEGRLREIAGQIEQFRNAVGLMLPAARQLALPITMYVFNERRDMEPFQPQVNGRRIDVPGAFVRDRDNAFIFLNLEDYEDASSVVYHEYTHLLLSLGTTRVPTWLNEGIAEYFSSFRIESGNRRVTLGVPVSRHVETLRNVTLIPTSQLLAVDQRSPLYNEQDRRSVFYAQAWALVHYIVAQVPGGPTAINRYLDALARGAVPDRAFAEAFGGTPAEFDRKLRTYVAGFTFGTQIVDFKEALKVTALQAARPVTSTELEARLGALQMRIHGESQAARRIEAAAANTTLAQPHIVLSQLRVTQKRIPEGLAALVRAVTLDPEDFEALYGFGMALMQHQSEAAAAGIEEPRTLAIAALVKALGKNQFASEGYAALAYGLLGEQRLPEARGSIERAMLLAPGRLDYHVRHAEILVRQGEIKEATTRLNAIVAVDPNGPGATAAKSLLAQIARREATLAAAPARGGAARSAPPAVSPNSSGSSGNMGRPRTTTPPPSTPRVRYDLRAVGAGEARAFGELTNVACADGVIRLHLKTPEREIIATAKDFQAIDIVSFRDDLTGTFGCGARSGDRVYLTWTIAAAAGGVAGQAVAVEFMPADYVP